MSGRIEFRLAGSGGQGIISAGIILASAAVKDGKYAIQSQSYGPEARGGASKAEVVISDEHIDYPKAIDPKYILCLTDESYKKYGAVRSEGSVLLADETVNAPDAIKVPILSIAKKLNPQGANVVAVGLLVGFTGVVSREAAKAALDELFPRFIEKNDLCLNAGLEYAKELLNK